jgi:hypothetical protein
MKRSGVPGFFGFFEPADPDTFQDEQLGWTTPSLLYALDAPNNVMKVRRCLVAACRA